MFNTLLRQNIFANVTADPEAGKGRHGECCRASL